MNEREWDKKLKIHTIGREDESNPNYSPYEPTPYAVLERLAQSGHVRRKDHLLDYGCGKGRVALYMAAAVGCRATGIDHSRKLIDIALQNRRDAKLGDRVTLTCCRAEQYAIAGENTLFFFNPFSEKVFEGVLRRAVGSWYERPRPMKILCYYPSEEYLRCLDDTPELRWIETIDCRDLFGGKNPREQIAVYGIGE